MCKNVHKLVFPLYLYTVSNLHINVLLLAQHVGKTIVIMGVIGQIFIISNFIVLFNFPIQLCLPKYMLLVLDMYEIMSCFISHIWIWKPITFSWDVALLRTIWRLFGFKWQLQYNHFHKDVTFFTKLNLAIIKDPVEGVVMMKSNHLISL